jgi:hypothetical protein
MDSNSHVPFTQMYFTIRTAMLSARETRMALGWPTNPRLIHS